MFEVPAEFQDKLKNAMKDESGAKLPFAAPTLWWMNGKANLKNVKEITNPTRFGGWGISKDEMDEIGNDWPEVPPHWNVCFAVSDCEATTAKAAEHGAQGGGMWPMNGSHMIDRLTFFFDSRIVAVKACVGSPFYGHSATDMGVAFLQFESGACATIMHAGYRDGVMRFEAEITGTEGQLRLTGRQLWRSREGAWAELPVPLPDTGLPEGWAASAAFVLELRDFAGAIAEFEQALEIGGADWPPRAEIERNIQAMRAHLGAGTVEGR